MNSYSFGKISNFYYISITTTNNIVSSNFILIAILILSTKLLLPFTKNIYVLLILLFPSDS